MMDEARQKASDKIARMIKKNLFYVDQGLGHGHYALKLDQDDYHKIIRQLLKGGYLKRRKAAVSKREVVK